VQRVHSVTVVSIRIAKRKLSCWLTAIKEQVVEMAINGSAIHDSSRVLKTNKNTVLSTLKKSSGIVQVNPNFQALNPEGNLAMRLVCDEAEMDEQRSFVDNKANQRWLWYAVDHAANTVLAWIFMLNYRFNPPPPI
jgi:hypothetical protein